MRKAAAFVGLALGLSLIVRAVAEPYVIDICPTRPPTGTTGADQAYSGSSWFTAAGSSWFTADQAW